MSAGYENSQPVPTVDFDYPVESPDLAREDESRLHRETIIRLIQFLATGSSVEKTGRRVQLIAFLLHVSECRTQRSLAKRLGISEPAVSKGVKLLRRKIAHINESKPPSKTSEVNSRA